MAPTSSLKRAKKGDGEDGAKTAVKREDAAYKDREHNSDPENSPDSQEDLEDVGSIMNMFQTTFAQRSGQKRKRSEQFLNASVKVSAKKIEDVVQRQAGERKKLQEQYQSQVDALINTWEGEIEKCKEMEEKLANTFRQQQKFYTTLRVNQTKILGDMKGLCKQYHSTIEQLDKLHTTQQGDIQGDLKREVGMLHKKYLMESHNSELATMKKNMQQMLTATFWDFKILLFFDLHFPRLRSVNFKINLNKNG